MLPNLGIIAGDGDLPQKIAELQQGAGGKCFIAALTPEQSFEHLEHKHFSLGAVGGIIKYFKQNSVENVIIIGGIDRPNLKSLKVDLSGSILLAKILKQKTLGDDNLLKIVANYIESQGIKVISPKTILNLQENNFTISSDKLASSQDKIDIEVGMQVIQSLGHLDVGQSVIVCDGYVVGIEAAEGTDNLISRCASLRRKKGGTLIKMSKSAQDMRLDIPVIGPDTITLLAQNNFHGVAIEKKGVIIIKPEETKILLDKYKLSLTFI